MLFRSYTNWLDLCPGATAPGERGSSWPGAFDDEIKQLVDSVRSDGKGGYQSTYRVFLTRAEAHAAIEKWVNAPQRVLPASELPDAPKPPPGYERWFLVDM